MKILVQYGFDTGTGEFCPSFGDQGDAEDVTAAPLAESHTINAHGACARGLVWSLLTADGATVTRIIQPPAALAAFARELAARLEAEAGPS